MRAIRMLSALPVATIEQLAGALEHAEVEPGHTMFRQGRARRVLLHRAVRSRRRAPGRACRQDARRWGARALLEHPAAVVFEQELRAGRERRILDPRGRRRDFGAPHRRPMRWTSVVDRDRPTSPNLQRKRCCPARSSVGAAGFEPATPCSQSSWRVMMKSLQIRWIAGLERTAASASFAAIYAGFGSALRPPDPLSRQAVSEMLYERFGQPLRNAM
ncbi:MAG: hypothetical protein QOK49_4177, partial [Baekduia sp.]|nr:hypothetical protein [Baekduia sp.]